MEDLTKTVAIKTKKSQKSKRYFNVEEDAGKPKVNEVQTYDLSKKKLKAQVKHGIVKGKRVKRLDTANPREKVDPFPGKAPISKNKVGKFQRGHGLDMAGIKTKHHRNKLNRKEVKLKFAAEQAARTERLTHEEAGFIEAEEGEETASISQHDIAGAVDVMSSQKFFDLNLQHGPYRINYTRNGRFLLIGGSKGECAALDWQTKHQMCGFSVMETINDIKWLHLETLFAVAQKQWTYIYDNQGMEIHCLKMLDSVLKLEFLPYHFLLASASAKAYLSFIDVSVGQKVAGFTTGLGRSDVMCQNPKNAIIHLGHSGGTVSLWSPNVKEPLVKMLCHGGCTRAVAVDSAGQYMATSGVDRKLKIWDLRTYKELRCYKLGAGPGHLSFSQRGLLAAGIGNVVEVYKDCCRNTVSSPYLCHKVNGSVHGLQFCPYEDVLGVGHARGFTSLLIPGAGEPNFDALEANPYQTKKQRQHAEVKMLLEKVPADMITLDTSALGQVDVKTVQEKMEEKKKQLFYKPDEVDFTPRHKRKGKSKTGKLEKRKQGVRFERLQDQVKEHRRHVAAKKPEERKDKRQSAFSVFDRFKKTE